MAKIRLIPGALKYDYVGMPLRSSPPFWDSFSGMFKVNLFESISFLGFPNIDANQFIFKYLKKRNCSMFIGGSVAN